MLAHAMVPQNYVEKKGGGRVGTLVGWLAGSADTHQPVFYQHKLSLFSLCILTT